MNKHGSARRRHLERSIRADDVTVANLDTVIGQSVERLEDPPLVRGRGRFAADISFPHQLHMRIVRANHAHGRIAAIDTSAARALPGVVAVWSAADIADIPPIDFREGRIPALEPYRQPVLATDKVRYVGDPVAAIFAEDPYVAEDAADLVTLEIEELPILLAAEAEPGEFSAGRNTEVAVIHQGYGDVDAVLRVRPPWWWSSSSGSAAIPACRWKRVAPSAATTPPATSSNCTAPPRCRTATATCSRACSSSRRPRSMCTNRMSAAASASAASSIRRTCWCCVAAMRLGRPVKWIEDRREHLIAANHSRQQLHRIRAAVDDEGRILAIDDRYFHDQGAYVRTHAARVVHMTAGILPGPTGSRPIAPSGTFA